LQTKKEKILDKFILGFVEEHISHRKFTEAFFNKSERFFKMHVMELRNGLFF